MRILIVFILCFLSLLSCKNVLKAGDQGDFAIKNYSNKVVEFVWIVPEGDFYPTARNISVGYGQLFELNNLPSGKYDIAIDFKNEFNSFNSKKDKRLCLFIEKGVKKSWIINKSGDILRE